MTNHAAQALQHLEAVTYDADRATVHALLDIAAAIRETRPQPVDINAGHVVPGFGKENAR